VFVVPMFVVPMFFHKVRCLAGFFKRVVLRHWLEIAEANDIAAKSGSRAFLLAFTFVCHY
jgi:hypothetical protein